MAGSQETPQSFIVDTIWLAAILEIKTIYNDMNRVNIVTLCMLLVLITAEAEDVAEVALPDVTPVEAVAHKNVKLAARAEYDPAYQTKEKNAYPLFGAATTELRAQRSKKSLTSDQKRALRHQINEASHFYSKNTK